MKSLGCTAVLVLWVTVAVAQPMPQGEDFQLNTLTPGYQDGVDIGVAADDEFVVVWHSPVSAGTDTDSNSVQARLYAGDGTPQGVEFQVNTYTTNFQGWPALAVASTGEFVVVWTSYQAAADSDGGSIQGQRFNADGTSVGEQFQVNTDNILHHRSPSVAGGPPGDFVVVWHSSSYAYPYGHYDTNIKAQRFTTPLFTDGFESGDTSAWSNSVP